MKTTKISMVNRPVNREVKSKKIKEKKNKKNIKILPQKWITLFDFSQNSSVAIHLPGYLPCLTGVDRFSYDCIINYTPINI